MMLRPRAGLRAAAAVVALALILGLGACRGSAPEPTAQRLPIAVSPDGRGDYPTLEAAVREAPAGATILVDSGTYELTEPLDVFRSLRLVATDAGSTVIESRASGHVLGFNGHGSLSIEGITFHSVGRRAGDPADVLLIRGGRVTLSKCHFEGAVAGYVIVRTAAGQRRAPAGGAGLRALGAAVVRLDACAFSDNALAGVARERGATVTTAGATTGMGVPDGADEPYTLPGKQGPRSATQLARFVDPQMRKMMRELHVPGAVLTVVRGGRTLYSSGYGLADVDRRISVDPGRTRFAVASITKLFTATAVMQLWERGRLELNRAVRAYVPATPSGPSAGRRLTVADLLTHAGGFDECWVGIAARSEDDVPPLTAIVRERPATRVLPPATVSSYANYDMTLLGAAVMAVSGVTYERWVDQQILRPLGMTASSFTADGGGQAAGRGSGGSALGSSAAATAASAGSASGSFASTGAASGSLAAARSAAGSPAAATALSYEWDGAFQARRPQVFVSAPAGGLYSTGADMARFMLAHLGGGAVGDARILQTDTVALMHAQQFANAATLPGYTYGFEERVVENRRALQHTGDFNGFSSVLFLVPDEDLGIFVAINGGSGRFCRELVDRIMAHYYRDHDELERPRAPRSLRSGLEQFVGTYRLVRHAHKTLDKWLEFASDSDLVVGSEPRGVLVIDDTRYVQMEPLQFRELYEDAWVTFARDTDGDIAFGFRSTQAFERLEWWETYVSQRRFIILFAVVLGGTVLAWVVAPLVSLIWHAPQWVRRLLAHQPFAARDPLPARVARGMAGAVALLDLTFLGIVGAAFTGTTVQFGVPGWLVATLVLPLLAATMTAGMAGLGIAAWARGWWTVAGRVIYCFITLAAAFFVWFVDYWNLLGFRF